MQTHNVFSSLKEDLSLQSLLLRERQNSLILHSGRFDSRLCNPCLFLLSSLIMWHQQVSGTQVSGQYYLYGGCEGMQEGMHVENGKSHRQSFFPGAADRSVMRSMPHLLKRGTAVSSGDHRKGHLSRGPTQEERTRCDSWGTPWRSDRRTCPQVLLAGNPHRITLASHSPF